jgi:RNA polymerase-binding transcription factor
VESQQLQRLKMFLEVRRKDLRLNIEEQLQCARQAEPESDLLDRASSVYDKQIILHRSTEEQRLLGMVEAALDRVRDGSYGQCLSCHEEIGGKRLAAVPWTKYCLECQGKSER